MENIFFAPPSAFEGESFVTIEGQEAQHISRVLRNKTGDVIYVADGVGQRFECEITQITKNNVSAACKQKKTRERDDIQKVLALGIIKKRDRLEFAIEKAVELGADKILLFQSDHSERSRINMERTRLLIQSAFKQSGRFWLPGFELMDSLDEVLDAYTGAELIMAHEEVPADQLPVPLNKPENVLLVGPEGGFSEREVHLLKAKKGMLISLGRNRLRAETAVTAILSAYLFS